MISKIIKWITGIDTYQGERRYCLGEENAYDYKEAVLMDKGPCKFMVRFQDREGKKIKGLLAKANNKTYWVYIHKYKTFLKVEHTKAVRVDRKAAPKDILAMRSAIKHAVSI